MDWKSDVIIESFNEVIKDSKNLNSKDLETKHFAFKESFNKLYEVAINAGVTGEIQQASNTLKMMLKARECMQEGKTTKLATDVYVGNQLGQKYIYPVTNTPSAEDYKQAFEKIKEKVKQNEKEDKEDKEDKDREEVDRYKEKDREEARLMWTNRGNKELFDQ